jgi:hypothetical protein
VPWWRPASGSQWSIGRCQSEARVGRDSFLIEHGALGLGNAAPGQELEAPLQATSDEGLTPCSECHLDTSSNLCPEPLSQWHVPRKKRYTFSANAHP